MAKEWKHELFAVFIFHFHCAIGFAIDKTATKMKSVPAKMAMTIRYSIQVLLPFQIKTQLSTETVRHTVRPMQGWRGDSKIDKDKIYTTENSHMLMAFEFNFPLPASYKCNSLPCTVCPFCSIFVHFVGFYSSFS